MARGGALAVVCLALSLSAHVAAGGQVHLSGGLLFGGLLLSIMCVAAAQSQGSFAGIVATVLLSQPVLHLLASASTHPADPAALVPSPLMVTYHVVGALVLSALLAGGDRVIWAFAALSRLPRVPRAVTLAVPSAPSAAVGRPAAGFEPQHLVLALAGLGRRGPPHG